MDGKFSTYDFLGYIMPGSIVVLIAYYYGLQAYPDLADSIGKGTFAATAFIVASFVAGHFVQALSSGVVETFLYFLAGGKPSVRLTTKGLKEMTLERWQSAKSRILLTNEYAKDAEAVTAFPDEEAIKIAFKISRKLGEVERFNGLYALNRALFMAFILCFIVALVEAFQNWGGITSLALPGIVLLALLVQRNRFRQRGEYLIIEAVTQAELVSTIAAAAAS